MSNRVIGILNMFNEPNLGPLTESRTLGSTSFLGRFAVMDFALSNFSNSNINNINILVKEHFRSIAKHVSNLRPWVNNTKIGRQNILINEKGLHNPRYNTDLACIAENDWVLYEADNADIVIIAPSYLISLLDYTEAIEEYIESKSDIAVLYTKISDGDTSFKGADVISVIDGKAISSYPNDLKKKHISVSIDTYILSSSLLKEMIQKYVKERKEEPLTIVAAIKEIIKEGKEVEAIEVKGYARMIDSMKSFMKTSFELLDLRDTNRLFKDDRPIFTLSHDTIPTIYGPHSNVKNSFVANGANIQGTVENSIISRRVKVAKGAMVKNSIILTATFIDENAIIENALIDKYAYVAPNINVKGTSSKPIYIEQGKKIK